MWVLYRLIKPMPYQTKDLLVTAVASHANLPGTERKQSRHRTSTTKDKWMLWTFLASHSRFTPYWEDWRTLTLSARTATKICRSRCHKQIFSLRLWSTCLRIRERIFTRIRRRGQAKWKLTILLWRTRKSWLNWLQSSRGNLTLKL